MEERSDERRQQAINRLRAKTGFGPITPVVHAAARQELLDCVSREPSLEESFLAQYGRDAVEEVAKS